MHAIGVGSRSDQGEAPRSPRTRQGYPGHEVWRENSGRERDRSHASGDVLLTFSFGIRGVGGTSYGFLRGWRLEVVPTAELALDGGMAVGAGAAVEHGGEGLFEAFGADTGGEGFGGGAGAAEGTWCGAGGAEAIADGGGAGLTGFEVWAPEGGIGEPWAAAAHGRGFQESPMARKRSAQSESQGFWGYWEARER